MKLKDIKGVFGSKKGDQLKIRSKKDKNLKRKLTSSMSKKLNRMNGIITDPAKSIGLETELKLSPAITVHYTSKIVDVAKVMSVKDNTTCVLVIDDRGQLCGILTDKDIVFRVLATGMDPKRTAVHTVMTANPVTATLETAKKVAMQAIYTGAFWHIPIISESDSSSVVKTNIIGMINLNELFGRDIVEKLQQTPSFMEFSSIPSTSDNSFAAKSVYSDIDMISRYEEIRQQKLTVVLDQHDESPPEIDGKMNVSIASNIMKIYKKGAVIVCDTDTRSLLGILTTQDLILRVVAAGRYPASTSAKSVMTPNPPVVNPNKQVSKTLQYMLDNNYKYIVIGADLKITGIVDILEVTRAALQQLQERDEIEEDARSRRSFSEDESYYEPNSRLMRRSSRLSLQSFDDGDKSRHVPYIKVDLAHSSDNILDDISDNENESDSDNMKPTTILPRDISLLNNIITETIPELDEEKETELNDIENEHILKDIDSPIEDERPREVVFDINETEHIKESSELSIINPSNENNIPINLPVIKIKLDPDTNQSSSIQKEIENDLERDKLDTNKSENHYSESLEELINNEYDVVESVGKSEDNKEVIVDVNDINDHQEEVIPLTSEFNANENEIVLPNDIEEDINEIIESSEIDVNIKDEELSSLEEVVEDENNKIDEKDSQLESNNIKNEPEDVIQTENLQEIIKEESKSVQDSPFETFENIDITSAQNKPLEEENVNEPTKSKPLSELESHQSAQPDIIPEFVISDEGGKDIINEKDPKDEEGIPFQNIPKELAMIEESINQYDMDRLTPVASTQTQQEKDVATFDALLEIEVNDEGIHNMDGNRTIYDMDDFVVSNHHNPTSENENGNIVMEDLQSNNYINTVLPDNLNILPTAENEPEVSEEAKRYVNNILGADTQSSSEYNEIPTEAVNDNVTEADNYAIYPPSNNISLERIKEEEPMPSSSQEFIGQVSNPDLPIEDKPSLEFSDINVNHDDNKEEGGFLEQSSMFHPTDEFGNHEIYDLSTIMPSSPPIPMETFPQDHVVPSLDLNEIPENQDMNSLKNRRSRSSSFLHRLSEEPETDLHRRSSSNLLHRLSEEPERDIRRRSSSNLLLQPLSEEPESRIRSDRASISSHDFGRRRDSAYRYSYNGSIHGINDYANVTGEGNGPKTSTNNSSLEGIDELSSTLQPSAERDLEQSHDDGKSAIMETIALDSESSIVLDHNKEPETVLERGNLIEFKKEYENEVSSQPKATPKSILEYIRQIVTPNVISHIFRYSLDKSQLDDDLSLDDNSTTMLVKRVVGGRDLYDEEDRRYNDRDDSSSTVLYPSQYLNTSHKRISFSRLAATQSIIKEEDLLLKCFDQETEQVYRINYNNDTKYEEVVNTIIRKSQIEDRDTLLFGYLDEDRDFIAIESEEDFLQGIWLARKLLWGRLFIVIKRKYTPSLKSLLPWGSRSAASNANNDQGHWLSNAMLIGVGVAATLAVKKISS